MQSPQTGIAACSHLAGGKHGGMRGRWRGAQGEAERSDHAKVMSRPRLCLPGAAPRWEFTRSRVHGWLVFGMHCTGLRVCSSVTELLYRSRICCFGAGTGAALTSYTPALPFSPCWKCFVAKAFLL